MHRFCTDHRLRGVDAGARPGVELQPALPQPGGQQDQAEHLTQSTQSERDLIVHSNLDFDLENDLRSF